MIYISHNLGLILETCHKLTVMYSGQAVETGSVKQVFDAMRHPYTRGLFNSIPLPGTDRFSRPLVPIRGQLPLPGPAVGLLVLAALRLFPEGPLRQADSDAGRRIRSRSRGAVRALQGNRLVDQQECRAAAGADGDRRACAGSERDEEILRDSRQFHHGADNRIARPVRESQRKTRLHRARGRDRGDRRRVRVRKDDLCQGADGS